MAIGVPLATVGRGRGGVLDTPAIRDVARCGVEFGPLNGGVGEPAGGHADRLRVVDRAVPEHRRGPDLRVLSLQLARRRTAGTDACERGRLRQERPRGLRPGQTARPRRTHRVDRSRGRAGDGVQSISAARTRQVRGRVERVLEVRVGHGGRGAEACARDHVRHERATARLRIVEHEHLGAGAGVGRDREHVDVDGDPVAVEPDTREVGPVHARAVAEHSEQVPGTGGVVGLRHTQQDGRRRRGAIRDGDRDPAVVHRVVVRLRIEVATTADRVPERGDRDRVRDGAGHLVEEAVVIVQGLHDVVGTHSTVDIGRNGDAGGADARDVVQPDEAERRCRRRHESRRTGVRERVVLHRRARDGFIDLRLGTLLALQDRDRGERADRERLGHGVALGDLPHVHDRDLGRAHASRRQPGARGR